MAEEAAVSGGLITNLFLQVIESPINMLLVFIIGLLIYLIIKSSKQVPKQTPPEPTYQKMKKRDFTVQELKAYDGTQEGGNVLVAVNGYVYDVTKGRRFYGPGGPYSAFGGRDASRGLATFSVQANGDTYDDLSDLNTVEMDSVREWEAQFKEKYDLVGRLLKPGEQPTSYSDEEDEPTSSGDKSKND